jgi:hypothetical protein
VSGTTALDAIKLGSVGTLQTKTALYRILRDEDWQKLVGLASEVHRIRGGVTLVLQAAKVVAKHKDQDSFDLFYRSVSMLSESSLLPERDGHEGFDLTPDELAENADEEKKSGVKPQIRRPRL